MTPRQAEIAGEAFVASQLARCAYDVLVQYGANQPHYDLVAIKGGSIIPVSVKGSQDGGWALAVSKIKKTIGHAGNRYHAGIDLWLDGQRPDVVFFFVQFKDVGFNDAPRWYVARPPEIASQLKTQRGGSGHAALHEDYRRDHPKSQYDHRIPSNWRFSLERLIEVSSKIQPKG